MSVQHVKKDKIIIGLTGNIASGKSTALNYFNSKGYHTIDSDVIVSAIWKDPIHLKALSALFNLDLSIEHVKKAFVVNIFKDETLKHTLESYIHPIVYKTIEAYIDSSDQKVIILDIPLLYETHYDKHVDAVILIIVDEDTQLKRLLARGYSVEHAKDRIKSQMTYQEKMKKTPHHILGDVPLESFYQSLEHTIRKLV
jgi:dephospho-CoA kinase